MYGIRLRLKWVVAALGVAVALLVAPAFLGTLGGDGLVSGGCVLAEEDGGGGAGSGYRGPHGMGYRGGRGGEGHIGGRGQGQGGPSADSDAKGPRYGGGGAAPGDEDRGGRPVWAQEGIPEVELGRLSVARAPSHVIQRALDEALAALPGYVASEDSIYLATDLEDLLSALAEEPERIDSPLANLGLYQDLLADGQIGDGTTLAVSDDNFLLLAALFLGGASDKTIPVSESTVSAMNTLLSVGLPEDQLGVLADWSDQVRAAILEAHEN